MGKSKYRYLIGTVVNGDWLVTGVDEWDKYICKCTHCGKTKKMRGGPLANGTARRCLCIEPPAIGFVDLTGRDFGQWHVEGYAGDGKWYCECSCGQARIIPGYTLKNGGTTSCGHKEDMIGQIFDDWEVIGEGKKQGYALCKCSCGAVKEVQKYSLRKGISKSCGHATTGFKYVNDLGYQWEMTGIAYADGYDVDDLKPAFDVFIQEKNPDNIVIYCDFSKDTGRAYEKLGFKRCAISEPNFVKYDEYLQDVTSLKVTDKNDLESKGCLLIYDCGTLRLALYK